MSAAVTPQDKKRIKRTALFLTVIALAFYFGIIALLVLRSRH
jgi:hypothetical protein